MANKVPINVPADDDDAQRIERQEQRWSGPKLTFLALVALGLALVLIVFAGQCELTGLPPLPF